MGSARRTPSSACRGGGRASDCLWERGVLAVGQAGTWGVMAAGCRRPCARLSGTRPAMAGATVSTAIQNSQARGTSRRRRALRVGSSPLPIISPTVVSLTPRMCAASEMDTKRDSSGDWRALLATISAVAVHSSASISNYPTWPLKLPQRRLNSGAFSQQKAPIRFTKCQRRCIIFGSVCGP